MPMYHDIPRLSVPQLNSELAALSPALKHIQPDWPCFLLQRVTELRAELNARINATPRRPQ